MKKIGIILDTLSSTKYLYETISDIKRIENVELYFLINKKSDINKGFISKIKLMFQRKGIFRTFELIIFKAISICELKILSFYYKELNDLNEIKDLNDFEINDMIYLNPIFSKSGIVVRYPDEDIEKIKTLKLDLIIRGNAPGIFKGEILNSSKDGIISFHHGDNRWNRGSPPAFWEVYFKKPSTGFIIQILTEKLDGGKVVFRGEFPTQKSYTENLESIYNSSNSYMSKVILDYLNNSFFNYTEENIAFDKKILFAPSLLESIIYVFRTLNLYLKSIFNRIIHSKKKRWQVAFINKSWESADLSKGVRIKNPKNRFFADPFIISKDNRTICYVEDYCYKNKRGCISAIEIFDNQSYKILGPVIKESFHLSFPFIFEYQNDLYMVPETLEANSIKLYKCTDFPKKWKFQKDIISNIKAVDTMIFEKDNLWWLKYNPAIGHKKHCTSVLMSLYANSPLSSDWKTHRLNPIVFDNSVGRNGGILQSNKNDLIRVRQNQDFNFYGRSISLAKINILSDSSFEEKEIKKILPDFFKNIEGCHHFHSNNHYTVYDFYGFNSDK
ncbi:MAG: hypothetical protein VXX25_04490 [Verrucomicrobiota bacterium]|nr:hypothetical protein [Verrucomicrobiota bacterium]